MKTEQIRARMRMVSGFVAGLIVLVLSALTFADAVVSMATGTPFMFIDNMNRGFESLVGLIGIIVAGVMMDLNRA